MLIFLPQVIGRAFDLLCRRVLNCELIEIPVFYYITKTTKNEYQPISLIRNCLDGALFCNVNDKSMA